jgi:hypothetical protein
VGYVFDRSGHAIRPIVGILGNSRIEAPIDLGLSVSDAAFLPDQKRAIVASAEVAEALVIDLEEPSRSLRIAGAPSSVSAMRMSRNGANAGFYYSENNQLLIINGLPTAPAVHHTVDVSFAGLPLTRFAVADDGAIALFAFHGEESDIVYSWTSSAGPRFVTTASRVADMIFMGVDALIADSGADQVVLIRNVRDQASPLLVADSRDGLSEPVALSVSSRNEIYIGTANEVLVMDATGHMLRKTVCSCAVTAMAPLQESALRLTDQLDQPLFVLDGESVPERILFVPALSVETQGTTQ